MFSSFKCEFDKCTFLNHPDKPVQSQRNYVRKISISPFLVTLNFAGNPEHEHNQWTIPAQSQEITLEQHSNERCPNIILLTLSRYLPTGKCFMGVYSISLYFNFVSYHHHHAHPRDIVLQVLHKI